MNGKLGLAFLTGCLLALIAVALGAPPAQAANGTAHTWYVNAATGDNDNLCNVAAKACKHIQHVIDKHAFVGDTIVLAPGVYRESLWIWYPITIRGAGPGTTFIDGAGNEVIYIDSSFFAPAGSRPQRLTGVKQRPALGQDQKTTTGETKNPPSGPVSSISRVTIRNGDAGYNFMGGGLYNSYGSTLTLTNVTFRNNRAYYGGGLGNDGYVTLADVKFFNNHASSGGGAYNCDGTLVMKGGGFYKNVADWGGGGFANDYDTVTVIANVVFDGNQAVGGQVTDKPNAIAGYYYGGFGGGIFNMWDTSLSGVTLKNNSALLGGGIYNDWGGGGGSPIPAANAPQAGPDGFYGPSLKMIDMAIGSNVAQFAGGGIYNGGYAVLTHGNVVFNKAPEGGGIYSAADKPPLPNAATAGPTLGITLQRTTISNNKTANCAGPVLNGGDNLEPDRTKSCFK